MAELFEREMTKLSAGDMYCIGYYKKMYEEPSKYFAKSKEVGSIDFRLYPVCNEYLGYLDAVASAKSFDGARVLCVCGSGDQILECVARGARSVLVFDVNPLCEYWLNLKIAAALALSSKECKKFFNKRFSEKFVLDEMLYEKIVSSSEIVGTLVWDAELGCMKGQGFWDRVVFDDNKVRQSWLFRTDMVGNSLKKPSYKPLFTTWSCKPFSSSEKLKRLKNNLKNCKIVFTKTELCDLSAVLSENILDGYKFDFAFLSNISDWYNRRRVNAFNEVVYGGVDVFNADFFKLMPYLDNDAVVQLYYNMFNIGAVPIYNKNTAVNDLSARGVNLSDNNFVFAPPCKGNNNGAVLYGVNVDTASKIRDEVDKNLLGESEVLSEDE